MGVKCIGLVIVNVKKGLKCLWIKNFMDQRFPNLSETNENFAIAEDSMSIEIINICLGDKIFKIMHKDCVCTQHRK
jgi:hypothetical protein